MAVLVAYNADNTQNFVYSGPDIHAQYGTAYTAPNALYVHGPNWDDPIMRLTGAGTAAVPTCYHQDGLGSVVATSSSTGIIAATQLFDAWGNKLALAGCHCPIWLHRTGTRLNRLDLLPGAVL